jgi:RecA/RadA recombinase
VYERRVTIVVGHFGSGKTEIAVNAALHLAMSGGGVTLVDLDVVKPYFRSRSTRAFMAQKNVRIVAPEGETRHADLPIILPEVRKLLQASDGKVILDVGGDPVGTRALGSVSDVVRRDETDNLLVLNFCRPYTETVDDAVAMAYEIEAAGRLPLTGLISNSHLMAETTLEVVRRGYEMSLESATRLGIPLVAVVVDEATAPRIDVSAFACKVVQIQRLIRPPFEQPRTAGRDRPIFVVN